MSTIDRPMLVRMLTAYGRSVADGDAEDLAELLALVPILDGVIRSTVEHMTTEQEISWATIGRAAGTTKQAAHQRWGPRPTAATG